MRLNLLFVCTLGLLLLSGCGDAATATPRAAPTAAVSGLGEADALLRAEDLLSLLHEGDYAGVAGTFDERMKGAISAAQLEQVWSSLLAQAGEYRSTVGARTEAQGQYLAVIQTLEFTKMNLDMRVAFDIGTALVSGLFFSPSSNQSAPADTVYSAPSYVDSRSFSEHSVEVGGGEWALPGTLSLPNRRARVPAVVLLHGSGPNDRDETLGGTKPFRDLAGGLASRGIAVLRFDKRTLVHGARMVGLPITVNEEVILDALAAIALLRARPEVDPAHVFVLGHSLGGMLAPRVASQDPALAGVIVMAGPSRRLEDLVLEQVTYLARLDGQVSAEESEQISELEKQVRQVKALVVGADPADLLLAAPASYWLDLQQYDATATARGLPQPMLFLQGERDYQVTLDDLRGWRAALGGRSGVEYRTYPLANHLFVTGTGPRSPQEYLARGHVTPEVINDIAQWIRANSGVLSRS